MVVLQGPCCLPTGWHGLLCRCWWRCVAGTCPPHCLLGLGTEVGWHWDMALGWGPGTGAGTGIGMGIWHWGGYPALAQGPGTGTSAGIGTGMWHRHLGWGPGTGTGTSIGTGTWHRHCGGDVALGLALALEPSTSVCARVCASGTETGPLRCQVAIDRCRRLCRNLQCPPRVRAWRGAPMRMRNAGVATTYPGRRCGHCACAEG